MPTRNLTRAVLAPFALFAVAPLAAAQVGSTTDLWDFSRGSVVTDHSPFDIDGGDHGGYDARDAFGGEFNDFPAAFGAVIFTDHQPRGSVHFIEWRTAAPITLGRFTMACSADHHAEDLRAVSAFRLYARDEAGAPWILLREAVRTERDILDHPLWTLDHQFDLPLRGLVEFRAEFVQASGRTDYGGPRVFELDGFGEYTWAAEMGVAEAGGSHGRRKSLGHAADRAAAIPPVGALTPQGERMLRKRAPSVIEWAKQVRGKRPAPSRSGLVDPR